MSLLRGEIMEFFRKHKKAITLIIGVSFLLWMAGLTIITLPGLFK
jgi:hypothetical protein